MSSSFTLNTSEAINDFKSYDKKTQAAMQRTLAKTAIGMSRMQHRTLRQQVKEWTGKLGGSISATRTSKNSYEIGPDIKRVAYAAYIEFGKGTFAGYHYVKRAFNFYRPKFIKALKKDIENVR